MPNLMHAHMNDPSRPVARINFEEVRDPHDVDLLDPRSGLLTLTL